MMDVTITDVTDEQVVLDANHALAGESLTFEIEVMEVL
jgi:peptidylprolyl isomerase